MMNRRAHENLSAANLLLPRESDTDPSLVHPNAAASRACYAAYHACWARLNEEGYDTPEHGSGMRYFRHESLPDIAAEAGILDLAEKETLAYLRATRIQADYWEDGVLAQEAAGAVLEASVLVLKLLGDDTDEG